jgi:beta-lactamase class A
LNALTPLVPSAALDEAVCTALNATGLRDIAAACVVDLGDSRVGHWRADDDIYPASIVKIALMMEAYARYADGSLRPHDRVRILAANLTPTAEPTPLVAGYDARVQELVDLMIGRSDNIATNQLIDLLRRERVTESVHALGASGFGLRRKLSGADPLVGDPEMTGRNSLSPRDAAHLLRLIALDAVPFADEQRTLLGRCMHDDKLTPGLREGDRFMHKTGETSSVSHDAGILRTREGREYIVVLYTTPQPDPSGADATHVNPRMSAWMRRLRDAL